MHLSNANQHSFIIYNLLNCFFFLLFASWSVFIHATYVILKMFFRKTMFLTNALIPVCSQAWRCEQQGSLWLKARNKADPVWHSCLLYLPTITHKETERSCLWNVLYFSLSEWRRRTGGERLHPVLPHWACAAFSPALMKVLFVCADIPTDRSTHAATL